MHARSALAFTRSRRECRSAIAIVVVWSATLKPKAYYAVAFGDQGRLGWGVPVGPGVLIFSLEYSTK